MTFGYPLSLRRFSLLVALFAALLLLLGPGLAYADPGSDEGGSAALAKQLEEAAVAYSNATVALRKSQSRQTEIEKAMKTAAVDYAAKRVEVGEVAAARYKGSQIGLVSRLLDTKPGDDMLQGAALAEFLIARDDNKLHELEVIRDRGAEIRDQLNAEIHNQEKILSDMTKAKAKAEKALGRAGGMVSAGFKGNVKVAQPTPRNADGSLPGNSCNMTDPTGTGGCISARMYHTLLEAQLAGYTHYTRCWRQASFGEHPLGRACDFSANANGFQDVRAQGADRSYGNSLAAWAVKNADALGVMYVIWYKQVWFPGLGWGPYTDGDGSPAGDHYNHVHISMY